MTDIRKTLQEAYDAKVDERDSAAVEPWKASERTAFLERLQPESKLLEVGAATGMHGAFFKENGLQVVSTDLSQAMVEACRNKGIEAYQMDFLSLDFADDTFDAIFALNCFLHVPGSQLSEVLENMKRLLRQGGLLYWGQYGGNRFEGSYDWDKYVPKRFFSTLSDEDMTELGSKHFELLDFHIIHVARDFEHFQSGTWQKS